MRLTYLPDGSPDCPLLVLSEFTPVDVVVMQGAARDLATGALSWERFDRHIEVASSVSLVFRRGDLDTGILATPPNFECVLTQSTWWQVEGLLEPFLAANPNGYQWLDRSGEVSLLISRDGSW